MQLFILREGGISVMKEVQTELSDLCHCKKCPYCNSANVYKRGKQKDFQMHQCKKCHKWYCATTGTPLWEVATLLTMYVASDEHQKDSERSWYQLQTSFNWRHKILSVLNEQVPEKK